MTERPDAEGIGLLQLLDILLKSWKLVVGLPLAAAIVTAGISLLISPKFTATATFVPETEARGTSLPGGLAGVAAQFGVSLGGSGGADSPAFYADVLKSRTLRDAILLASFADPRSGSAADSSSLLDLLEVEGDSEAQRLEVGRKELAKYTQIRVESETGIVAVSVETRHRTLSADVANFYIDLLNRFNLETRQSNAEERRRFVEERVTGAGAELQEAEEAYQNFLERNRQYAGSPELNFQAGRLQRQVTIKQEVLTTLRRQYEEARIQEVNDTPVITVIDWAVPPDEKSSPKRRASVVLAFFLGGVLAVVGAFGQEFIDRARVNDQEQFEKISSRWEATKQELLRMFRIRRGS